MNSDENAIPMPKVAQFTCIHSNPVGYIHMEVFVYFSTNFRFNESKNVLIV